VVDFGAIFFGYYYIDTKFLSLFNSD